MSGQTTIVVIVLAVWLGALTIALIACVRQIALLGLRADQQLFGGVDPVEDGLKVGSPTPEPLRERVRDADGPAFVLILSSNCMPCRDLTIELEGRELDSQVLACISGPQDLTRPMAEMVAPGVEAILDPDAKRWVEVLQIKTTPFVFEFRGGLIAAKAAIRGIDHLLRFVAEAESVPNEKITTHFEERHDDVHVG